MKQGNLSHLASRRAGVFMVLAWVWIAPASSGCMPDASPIIDGDVTSCVQEQSMWNEMRFPLDILIVLDNAPRMSSYPMAIPELAESVAFLLDDPCQPMDIHVGMVSGDLADDGLMTSAPTFLTMREELDGSQTRNFSMDATEKLAAMATGLGTGGDVEQRPLEVMRRALDGRNAGFLRPDAFLLVVFVTATDDASAGPVGEYAAFLKALKPSPNDVLVSTTDTPRMRAFVSEFPRPGSISRIDVPGEVSGIVAGLFTCWGLPPRCFFIDDPATAACVVTDVEALDTPMERQTVIPSCADSGGVTPCWRIGVDEICSDSPVIRIERPDFVTTRTLTRVSCEICAVAD